MPRELRPLGRSGIGVTAVGLGCWPIAGMTSVDVNERDSLRTIRAAIDAELNFFDTAYCYGANGESERLIARGIAEVPRTDVVIATKGGIHWDGDGRRIIDGNPQRLHQECDESLQRLNTDYVDVFYLHAPDPNVPIEESAEALEILRQAGKTRAVGLSNATLDQIERFHDVCRLDVIQPPYNMLQREIESDIVPWCQRHDVAVAVYWPLMKGLLAGKLHRDHAWAPGDGRAKYAMFQGDEFQRNLDFVDDLRRIANDYRKTVAQLVIAWTIAQPGITSALCGAKRPEQIEETAAALDWALDESTLERIHEAIERRGQIVSQKAV